MNENVNYIRQHKLSRQTLRQVSNLHFGFKEDTFFDDDKGLIQTNLLHPEKDMLVQGTSQGWLIIDDMENGGSIMVQAHASEVASLAFIDTNLLISGGSDGLINLIRLDNSRYSIQQFSGHHIRSVNGILGFDEQTFITCSYDKTIRIFDTRTASEFKEPDTVPMRPFAYGGGVDGFAKDGSPESLLIDLRKVADCELYSINPKPDNIYQFIVSTGRSSVIEYDLRSAGTDQMNGFNLIKTYQGHAVVTSAVYDAFGDYVYASVKGGSITQFDAMEKSILPLNHPRDRNRFPSSYIRVENVLDSQGRLDPNRFNDNDQAGGNNLTSLLSLISRISDQTQTNYLFHFSDHSSSKGFKNILVIDDYIFTGTDHGRIVIYDGQERDVATTITVFEEGTAVNHLSFNEKTFTLAASGDCQNTIVFRPFELNKVDSGKAKNDAMNELIAYHEADNGFDECFREIV